MISFTIHEANYGQTLEKFVKKVLPNASLSFIYKLFRKKDVKVNGHWQDLKYVLNKDEVVSIYVTDAQLEEFKKVHELKVTEDVASMILYEDQNVIILNKPRNLLVQKDSSGDVALDEMVLSYLARKGEYDPDHNEGFTPGPAHRIDRNTSGIVVFGKNVPALQMLFSLFKDHEDLSKHYLALVKGRIEKDGVVDAPLSKNEKTGRVSVITGGKGGKPAKTIYHVLETFHDYSLLDLILLTGRTHQIRVHMSYIGHPLIGDTKYGDYELNKEIEKKYHFRNQFLHASEIHFGDLSSPLSQLKSTSFKAEMPSEEKILIEKLKANQ